MPLSSSSASTQPSSSAPPTNATVKMIECRTAPAQRSSRHSSVKFSRPTNVLSGSEECQLLMATLTFQPMSPYTKTAIATIDGDSRISPGSQLRTPRTRCLHLGSGRHGGPPGAPATHRVGSPCYFAFLLAASASAFWSLPTSLLCRNRPSAVSTAVSHAALATTPCCIDPTSLSLFHSSSAHAR